MKNYMRVLLILLMIMTMSFSIVSNAASLDSRIDQPRIARVIEVIDTDVIKVWLYNSDFNQPEIKLIKMIGVSSDLSEEAYEFTKTNLLGNIVYITADSNDEDFPNIEHDDIEYAYVYRTTYRSFSEELLINGYAEVNTDFYKAKQYDDLLAAEIEGKNSGEGMWQDSETALININTATRDMLVEIFDDVSISLANKILNYRSDNYFNSVDEIKFVDEFFDSEWLADNKEKMSVVTNVNYGNVTELSTLFSTSASYESIAQDLMDYRTFNNIKSLTQLKNIESIEKYYDEIYPFASVDNQDILVEVDKEVVNINTATRSDFVKYTDLTDYMIEKIISYRKESDYIFKYPGELMTLGNPLDTTYELEYVDELTCFTDINNASEIELISLFGIFDDIGDKTTESIVDYIIKGRPYNDIYELKDAIGAYYYQALEPYIYTAQEDFETYINVNSYDYDEVIKFLNMSEDEEEDYIRYRKYHYYEIPTDIDFDIEAYNDKISLFTNVNEASYYELKTLHSNMTDSIVNDIIDLRAQEYITSLNELEEIFVEHHNRTVFEEIQELFIFY